MAGLLRQLIGMISGGPYYVRINRERIAVRNVSSGDYFECRTLVGLDGADRVVSVGLPVSPEAAQQVNPFEHPRVLVDDYVLAEAVFSHAVKKVAGMSLLQPSPIIVVHPDLQLDGGLTPVEIRVLNELADSAGARKTIVHTGQVLSDEDVTRVANDA